MNKVSLFNQLEIDSFFDEFFNSRIINRAVSYNLIEKDVGYIIEFLVPGINKENLTVEVEDGYLKINGQTKKHTEELKIKSFNYTTINKTIKLSDNIDVSEIKADIIDGILSINLPFTKEKKEKRKKIQIS